MDIISLLAAKLSFVWEIGVPFLAALTILVFVHELGHYMVARWCNVKIEVFSIGFGPELIGWNDRLGTRWRISAIPLGGYVKMFGESETVIEGKGEGGSERPMTPEEEKVSFHHKPLPQRAAIVIAGPAINFIFAIVAFALLFMTIGVPNSSINKLLAIVGNVSSGSAAAIGGLKTGDQITQIGDEKINYFVDLQRVIKVIPNKEIKISITRAGKKMNLNMTTGTRTSKNAQGAVVKHGLLGISARPGEVKYIPQSPGKAIGLGFERTYVFTLQILEYIGDIIVGKKSADELGGVLRIAQISGQVAELGIVSFISFLAILSVNLGLINLFPIPLLDGGHLAFYTIEAIRGRPMGPKAHEYSFRFGLTAVVGLFLFVTWNDLVHLEFIDWVAKILT
jgi:regulator of sigma E protease